MSACMRVPLWHLIWPLTFFHYHGNHQQLPVTQSLDNNVHLLLPRMLCGAPKGKNRGEKLWLPRPRCQLGSFLLFQSCWVVEPFSLHILWLICLCWLMFPRLHYPGIGTEALLLRSLYQVQLAIFASVGIRETCNFSHKVDLSWLILCSFLFSYRPVWSASQKPDSDYSSVFQAGTDGWPRLAGNASSLQISLEPHKLLTDWSEVPQLTSDVLDM